MGQGGGGEQLPLWLDILNISFRTVFLFFLVLVVMRLVGKRSLSKLAPFDLAILIIMGSVAAIPIEEQTGLIHGIVPIVLLGALQYLLDRIATRSRTAERIIQGRSAILVQDGRILHNNLMKENVSLADLWLNLRESGIDEIQDVQQATLEPDGKISVVKTKAASPVTPKDVYKLAVTRTDAISQQNLQRMRGQFEEVLARRRLLAERARLRR